jgi:hypothetical protein
MSYPPPPPRPVAGVDGQSPELLYMQKNWDIHWDPKVSIFVDTPLLKFNKTPKGYVPVLKIPPTKTGGSKTTNFQGVYTPGIYNTYDEVIIQSGPGNGAWVCLAEGNSNDPRTGINWIQFSSLNQWF